MCDAKCENSIVVLRGRDCVDPAPRYGGKECPRANGLRGLAENATKVCKNEEPCKSELVVRTFRSFNAAFLGGTEPNSFRSKSDSFDKGRHRFFELSRCY